MYIYPNLCVIISQEGAINSPRINIRTIVYATYHTYSAMYIFLYLALRSN